MTAPPLAHHGAVAVAIEAGLPCTRARGRHSAATGPSPRRTRSGADGMIVPSASARDLPLCRTCRAGSSGPPLPRLCVEVAQAATMARFGPFAPVSMAIIPAHMSGDEHGARRTGSLRTRAARQQASCTRVLERRSARLIPDPTITAVCSSISSGRRWRAAVAGVGQCQVCRYQAELAVPVAPRRQLLVDGRPPDASPAPGRLSAS